MRTLAISLTLACSLVLLAGCESVSSVGESIGLGPDLDPNSFPAFGSTSVEDGAVKVKLRPDRRTNIIFLFSSSAPAGVKFRVNIQDPGNPPFTSPTILESVVSRSDGTEIVGTELRLWDKVRALELLGKHFGLWAPEQTPVVPIQVNVMGVP